MTRAIIHVNRHHIQKNATDGGDRPVYTIKRGKRTTYARQVAINGPSLLVYNGKTLSCGARAWIETDADLVLIGECNFQEATA